MNNKVESLGKNQCTNNYIKKRTDEKQLVEVEQITK